MFICLSAKPSNWHFYSAFSPWGSCCAVGGFTMPFLNPGFLCCWYPQHRAVDKHTPKEQMFVYFSIVWECLIPCNPNTDCSWQWVPGLALGLGSCVCFSPSDKHTNCTPVNASGFPSITHPGKTVLFILRCFLLKLWALSGLGLWLPLSCTLQKGNYPLSRGVRSREHLHPPSPPLVGRAPSLQPAGSSWWPRSQQYPQNSDRITVAPGISL